MTLLSFCGDYNAPTLCSLDVKYQSINQSINQSIKIYKKMS